jgi:hypothetical protein
MGTRQLDVSAQDLLSTLSEQMRIRHIRPGEITIRDYAEWEDISEVTARGRLMRLVELGELGTEYPVKCGKRTVRVFFARNGDGD